MHLLPLHYYVDCSYGILLKGAGIAVLWPMMLGILAIGASAGAACLLRFKKQFG
jgi:ABC-2 type transport system permease protein